MTHHQWIGMFGDEVAKNLNCLATWPICTSSTSGAKLSQSSRYPIKNDKDEASQEDNVLKQVQNSLI